MLSLILQPAGKICYCINDVSSHTAVSGCVGCRELYPQCGETKFNTAAVYAGGHKGNGRPN